MTFQKRDILDVRSDSMKEHIKEQAETVRKLIFNTTDIRFVMIAAAAMNGIIGKDGSIPWDCWEDRLFFKHVTHNSFLIMGRKTYESLPEPLVNRACIVVGNRSQRLGFYASFYDRLERALSTTVNAADYVNTPTINFIAGGSSVYEQALPYVDMILMTELNIRPDGDREFPKLKLADWERNVLFSMPHASVPHNIVTYMPRKDKRERNGLFNKYIREGLS